MNDTDINAPVVIFAYNRVDHLKKTLEALNKNALADETIVFIFSDGPKDNKEDKEKIEAVRIYLKNAEFSFRELKIIEREYNMGLAANVISSVSEIIEKYGKVIALEDDLVTSSNFLTFMNEGLNKYKNYKKVWSLTGFLYPIDIPSWYKKDLFLTMRASSLGWGTWKDRWACADWEISNYPELLKNRWSQHRFNKGGRLMSALRGCMNGAKRRVWAIRWSYNHFLNKAYCAYPTRSLVKNIGYDDLGTNDQSKHAEMWESIIIDNGDWNYLLPDKMRLNKRLLRIFREHFTGPNNFKWYVKQYLILLGLWDHIKLIRNKYHAL